MAVNPIIRCLPCMASPDGGAIRHPDVVGIVLRYRTGRFAGTRGSLRRLRGAGLREHSHVAVRLHRALGENLDRDSRLDHTILPGCADHENISRSHSSRRAVPCATAVARFAASHGLRCGSASHSATGTIARGSCNHAFRRSNASQEPQSFQ